MRKPRQDYVWDRISHRFICFAHRGRYKIESETYYIFLGGGGGAVLKAMNLPIVFSLSMNLPTKARKNTFLPFS